AQLIAELGASAPASDLMRRVPGVSLTQAGPTGTTSTLRIRGAGPKYTAVFVDGVRVDDPTGLSTQFDFGALGVTDIGRLEVLRGSQSALYGGSAVAGVVNISSRRPDQDGFSQTANAEVGSNKSLALAYGMFFRDERVELALNLTRRQTDGFSAWEGPLPAPKGLEKDGFESN
ncbi:TonB-dependent receptor, partial [Saccharopolyspora hordei]|uniref:TonB-dependent receptor n=1 Tax=Saccharopolyspora hordei TaxID=1838 RepID=UPI0035EC3E28